MSATYAYEKFWVGVQTLATGSGRIKERLESAYVHSLIRVNPEDLPGDLGIRFNSIQDEITKLPAVRDEGTAAATLKEMSEERACQIAKELVEIYEALADTDPLRAAMRADS
jgi:hypothetical protein